jgi:hypothetical protein
MLSQEQRDPTLELLRRLPRVSPDAEAAARVRRRCHAAMAHRTARRARSHSARLRGTGRLFEAVLVLSMGVYLAASVAEALRVVVAF